MTAPGDPCIELLRGLPASGKSTLAREFASVYDGAIVSRDSLRRSMFGLEGKMRLHPDQEAAITRIEEAQARAALIAGLPVVVDDMNLRNDYVRRWEKLASEAGVPFAIQDLTDVPLEECLRRNRDRSYLDEVPDRLIRELHQKYVKGRPYPLPYESKVKPLPVGRPYFPDAALPPAIIVDVDGTIASHEGIRGHHEYEFVSLDKPVGTVIHIIQAFLGDHVWDNDLQLIIVSGRPDSCRQATKEWISLRTPLLADKVLMRREGDKRSDDIVKLEIFDSEIRDKYNVQAVFDDRDRVVKMWRSLGLKVLQVADGNF